MKNINLLFAICYFYKDRNRIIRAFLSNGMICPFLKLGALCILLYLTPLLLAWCTAYLIKYYEGTDIAVSLTSSPKYGKISVKQLLCAGDN